MVLLVALGFAIRGLFRGLTSELFGLLGVVAGLWVAAFVARWVGAHWEDARPAVVFWLLRWVVAVFAGVALATVFAWWGALLSSALKKTPIGVLEHPGGALVGALTGVSVVALALVAILLLPGTRSIADVAAGGRLTRPLLAGATHVLEFSTRYHKGSDWLRRRFLEAERRAALRAKAS